MHFRLFFLLLLVPFFVQAQNKLSGTVVDNTTKQPIPGANLVVKGSKVSTSTDFSGTFQLSSVSKGDQIVVSFVGFKSQTVIYSGQSSLTVLLQEQDNELKEVVVQVGYGSVKRKDATGSVTTLATKDFNKGVNVSTENMLTGRVAGLSINSSGAPGSLSEIRIRGGSSLFASNDPLIVIDGVITDYFPSFSPDEVESITILKDAASTALYGSRGSNGVIMITTKRGQKDQGLGVEYSSTVGFETVTKLPKLQSEYGGGYGYAGDYGYGSEGDDFKTKTVNGVTYTIPDYRMDESWGPKLDGRQVVSWADLQKWEAGGKVGNPTTSAWSPATSDYRDFFKTGVSYTNNVAISKAYDNSAFRISYTNTAMTGYLPNSSQYKNTVSVNGNIMSKDKKLNVFTSVNFFNSRTKGRQDTGYGDNNIMVKFTQWGQRQLNMDELKALYLKADGTQGSWNRGGFDDPSIQFHNNVYWSRYMNYENDSRNRIYGNVGVNYQILPQLKAQYKVNLDFYADKQYERNAVYSQELSGYKESSRQQYEINHEFMLMYNQAFGDYSVTANLGANIMQRHYELIYGQTKGGLAIPLFYNLANSITTPQAYNYKTEKGINSLFGDVTLGWKSMLYLEATLRGDKSSTLPKSNNTYVYPSVTASWLFSELLKDKTPWLSYGKLRAGYARVGNDTDPYQVMQTYTQYTNIDSSTPGYRLSNTLSNSNLKPESTKSWEFGLETSFLNNRLGFDLTYYTTTTSNEILPLSVSGSTGYMYKMINSGTIENKGVEFAFHATPVKTRQFEWTTNVTLASNKNTVKSLAEGVDYFKIATAPFKVEIGAVVGKPYGVIMGTNYVYDKNGNKCVDSKGLYMSTSSNEDIGHIYPDFTGGWSNSFKWGNFDASFQFDFSKGGHFFSTTQMWGYYCGMFAETAENGVREKGIISDGVVYGTGEKNTVRVSARDYYENYYNGPAAQNILRSDYIKLREVTVGYTFKLNPVWFIKSLRLSAYGRNLGVWGPDCKNFDPEMIVTSSGNIQGIEGGATPMVANYGVTVNLKF